MTTANLVKMSDYEPIVAMVLDGLDSPQSRRAYRRALVDFLDWYAQNGNRLDKATANRYKGVLEAQGLSPSSINQRLSAIRKLSSEAADNGLLDPTLAAGISKVKGTRQEGNRAGNWLTRDQAQRLLDAPDTATLRGARDRAILAVLLGCGLRRAEVTILTFEHIQQRDGRWVIVDLVGKRKRIRSIPMPSWAKAAIDRWSEVSGLTSGSVFTSLRKGGAIDIKRNLSPQAIFDVVRHYAEKVGVVIAAHDLRRTYAKLAHQGGARLEQIQLSLGHASLKTTEVYLGLEQDLNDAPCDHLGLTLRPD